MRCRRAEEVNVEDFLVDSTHETFDAFRAHYPDCGDCAEAVATWSALEWAIRENAGKSDCIREAEHTSGHPSPAMLESFVNSPEQRGAAAMQIEAHLTNCGLCRNEVSLLRQFDPTLFQPILAPASAPAVGAALATHRDTGQEGGFAGVLNGLGNFLSGLGDSLFAPGIGRLAVPAVLLAIAVALAYANFPRLGTGPSPETPVQIAEEANAPMLPSIPPTPKRPQEMPSSPVPSSPDSKERTKAERLAEGRLPRVPDSLPGLEKPKLRQARSPQPETYANAENSSVSDPSEQTSSSALPTQPERDTPPDEILLAALTELPLPTYHRPDGGSQAGWMGQFGPVRSSGSGPKIQSLAPTDHTGLTLDPSPHLWWMLDKIVEQPLQVTVVDDTAIEPLLRIELPGPHVAGVHEIDLSQHQLTLSSGKDYRWFVSILLDPNRPSRNPIAAGALRVLPAGDERRAELGKSAGAEKGHRLAELGIWYDAYDYFARLARQHPEQSEIQTFRDGLAKQIRSEE